MFNLNCIKCGTKYQDNIDDAYYCSPCKKEHLKLAEEIQKKVGNRPRKENLSLIKKYESLPKVRGFVNAKDLLL